jgi:hypothetical protein
MRRPDPVCLSCPYDGTRRGVVSEARAGRGWTVRLYGCRGCQSGEYVAVAVDVIGQVRPVGRWRLDPDAGLYVVTPESRGVLPGWLDRAAGLLPSVAEV